MILTDTFYSDEENALSEEFLKQGYVVKPVADRLALDAMRTEVARLVCSYLSLDFPDEVGTFLNQIQNYIPQLELNDLRLYLYKELNQCSWYRPTYFKLARPYIESLGGNELAMQNRINLSIQMPDDDSSLLTIHTDLYGGETPFQIVEWIPLVDVYDTKAMFLLPPEYMRKIIKRLKDFDETGMDKVFEEVRDELVWIEVSYGDVLIFSPNLFHGNVLNVTEESRWSMNVRITGLFTPYGTAEKKLGSYYLPITTRVVSRVGMDNRLPNWTS